MAVTASNAVTNSTSYSYARSTSDAAVSDANAAQDRFLKLLIAQLANQDPMNPMDNAQMTSQMAQINTVSGIQQVNASIQSMAKQFGMLQTLQSAQSVGRDVLVNGNAMPVNNGVASGVVELSSNADSANLKVYSAGGVLLDTVELGSLSAGSNSISWDGSQFPQATEVRFQVSASASGKSVNATMYSRQNVTAVESTSTGPKFTLQLGSTVNASDISAFY